MNQHKRNPMLSEPLQGLFIKAIAITAGDDLRRRFARAGISSDELPLPMSPGGYPRETRPVAARVARYFAALDLSNRQHLCKLLPLCEDAIEALRYHPSGLYNRILNVLNESDLGFKAGRIVKRMAPLGMGWYGKAQLPAFLRGLHPDTIYSPTAIAGQAVGAGFFSAPPREPQGLSRYRVRLLTMRRARQQRFPKQGDHLYQIPGQSPTPGWSGSRWKSLFFD